MKGNIQVMAQLSKLLSEELTAINQYMVHAEMCANLGYSKLAAINKGNAISEMRHSEKLIERAIFLEGVPIVDHYGEIKIGARVDQQLNNDLKLELGAVASYNVAITVADLAKDAGTRELLEGILVEEEGHLHVYEQQLDQISQMGLENYLSVII